MNTVDCPPSDDFSSHAPAETDAYKALARRWASAVTVVTGRRRGANSDAHSLDGFTATAALTVSLDPPIVLVSANRSTTAGAMALACDAFTINLLSEAQRSIAERFAAPHESRGDVFAATPHRLDPEGAALFDGALGAFSGRVRSLVDAGDHVLVLLDVTRIRVARASTAPLLYVDRAFCRVGDRL